MTNNRFICHLIRCTNTRHVPGRVIFGKQYNQAEQKTHYKKLV